MALWRYQHRFLSPPVEVLKLDLATSPAEGIRSTATELPIIADGTCHACIMWVDYHVGSRGAAVGPPVSPEASWCTTAPSLLGEATPCLQGIRYCAEALPVDCSSHVVCDATVDALAGLLSATVHLAKRVSASEPDCLTRS